MRVKLGYNIELINISLHLIGFSLMFWSIEKLWMSDTVELSRLIEFLGSNSMTDVSSTNLTLGCQSAKGLFVISVKSITPSLVSWGTLPLRNFQSDNADPILTACCLSVTQQSNWWARDQPLVFATQSLRCYGQLDQSLSKSQRRRPRHFEIFFP